MKRLARAWRPAYRAAEHRASRVRAASALGRLLFCCLVSAQAIAGPYEDGIAAYDRGEYAAALSLWLPLAEHGNVSAQYNLGMLYRDGKGVPKDIVNGTINNQYMDVPASLLPIENITADNLSEVVSKGVWTWKEICQGVEGTAVCKANK